MGLLLARESLAEKYEQDPPEPRQAWVVKIECLKDRGEGI
jgi:hypothetical protein